MTHKPAHRRYERGHALALSAALDVRPPPAPARSAADSRGYRGRAAPRPYRAVRCLPATSALLGGCGVFFPTFHRSRFQQEAKRCQPVSPAPPPPLAHPGLQLLEQPRSRSNGALLARHPSSCQGRRQPLARPSSRWRRLLLDSDNPRQDPPPGTVTLCRSSGIHWLTAAVLQPSIQDPTYKHSLKRGAGQSGTRRPRGASPAAGSAPALDTLKGLSHVTRSAESSIGRLGRLPPRLLQTGLRLPVCLALPEATRTVPDLRPQGKTNISQPPPFILSPG